MSAESALYHLGVDEIARGVIKALDGDALGVAFGMIVIARMIAGDDPVKRTALARELLVAARQLDPDARLGLDA